MTTDELVAAFDHAPVGMAITGEGATILRVNAALARMLGYTPEEMVGKSVRDLTHPDDLEESLSSNRRIVRGEVTSFSLEKRYLHKSGRAVWARVFVSVLGNEPRRHLLHVADISQEKLASVRLRDTESRFREMGESIEQDFWILSVDPFELLYASPAATRIWGFDPMTNRDRPGRIRKLVHPDDVGAFLRLFDASLPEPRELEYRVARADDGTPRWFRTRVFPVRDAAGTIIRLSGVTDDITPRKEAELQVERHRAFEQFIMRLCTAFVNLPAERVQETLESALGELARLIDADRAAIFVIDEKTDVLSVHYSWSRDEDDSHPISVDFSFTPDNPLRARILEEGLLRIDDVDALPDALADIRAKLVANRVGSVIDLPLVRHGKLLGLYGFGTVGRKVTWPAEVAARLAIAAEVFSNAIERARMEAEVRRHRDALAHALRVGTMGQLASGIAHELNQPLAAILNYASAAERRAAAGGGDITPVLDALRKIAEQAVRAADVIKTLRALVRKGEAERTWRDLRELVRTAIGFIQSDVIEPAIEIVQRHSEDVPNVQVDPIQIEQVVLNLVRNAVDAVHARRDDGGGRIDVETRLASSGMVEVRVSDNGAGIEPGWIELLFDEFSTTKPQGLGLGLSISRSIIESHGGRLWMERTAPTGTTFCFTLPAAPH